MNQKIVAGLGIVCVVGAAAYFYGGKSSKTPAPLDTSDSLEVVTEEKAASVTAEDGWLQDTDVPTTAGKEDHSKAMSNKSPRKGKDFSSTHVLAAYPQEVREHVVSIAKNSGVEDRLSSLTDAMEQQLSLIFESQELDPSLQEDFNKLVQDKFDGEKLMNAYLSNIAENFSAEDLAKLDQAYQDPAMIEFVQKGAQLSDPSNVAEITQQYEEYANNSEQNPEITKQAAELNNRLGYSNQMTQILKEVTNGMGGTEFTPEIENDVAELVKAQMTSALSFQMKDMSAGSRAQLLQISEDSPLGALNEALTNVIKDPVKETIQEISRLEESKKDSGSEN